jgi:hypothetical protein
MAENVLTIKQNLKLTKKFENGELVTELAKNCGKGIE